MSLIGISGRKFWTGIILLAALLGQVLARTTVVASAQPTGCQEGTHSSGARYRICPSEGQWNGDLVLYAHGYVQPDAPLALPAEAGTISAPLRAQGYAFATTSYRMNGLAVLPAIQDLLDLVAIYAAAYQPPRRIFLIGASEGGLITTLSVERYPEVYAGGLEMCGPNNIRDQIQYFGDFRVALDAFFPELIPSDPVRIPPSLAENWSSIYQNSVLPVLRDPANQARLKQVFQVSGASYDPDRPETMESTARGVLSYNILASGDAAAKLGGQPFGNLERVYHGSEDEAWLNRAVQCIQADPAAARALDAYESSGRLRVPLVGMHTSGDEIVPFFHLDRYAEKAAAAGNADLYLPITIQRYGHCSFTSQEILDAFQRLVVMADGMPVAAAVEETAPEQQAKITAAPAHTETPVVEKSALPEPAPRKAASGLWARVAQFFRGLVQ